MNQIKKILFSAIAVCTTAAIGITALANGTGLLEPNLEGENLVPGFSMDSTASMFSASYSENNILSADMPELGGLIWMDGLISDNPPTYDFGTRTSSTVVISSSNAPTVKLYNGSGEKITGLSITSDSPDAGCFQVIGPGATGGENYLDSDTGTQSTVNYVLLPVRARINNDRLYSATYTIGGIKENSKEPISISITLKMVYDDSSNPNHKVTFDSQGGTQVYPKYAAPSGEWPIEEPNPPPTRQSYIFGGWYTEPACTNAWNFNTLITEHRMTLYAKWTPDGGAVEGFTVTYNSVGGNIIAPVTGVITGSKINPPLPPKKSDNTFENWYKEVDYINLWDFSKDTVTSNVTLFAKWKETSGSSFEYVKKVSTPSNGSLWITWDNDKTDGGGRKIALRPSDFDITYERADDPPKTLVLDADFTHHPESSSISCTFKPIPETTYAQIVTVTVVYKGQTEGKSDSFVVEPGTGSITPDDGKCTVVLKNKFDSPISGAKVSMISSGDKRVDVITDTNGEAPFQLDPRLDYIMLVEKSGYHKIEWPPRNIGQIWNVFMEETSSSSGGNGYCNFTVVDENNSPVSDARIEFRCPGDNTSGNGMTDSSGLSRILVNKNTYELTVVKNGYENYKAVFPVMSAEQSLKIQLKTGTSIENPDFTTICTVRTMVRDPYGNPIPNANISLLCPADSQIGKSVSSSSGLSNPPVYIRSNNYILTVSKSGYESYEKSVVVSGEEKTFNVVLSPISQIGGDDSSSLPPPSTNNSNNSNDNTSDRKERPSSGNSESSSDKTSTSNKPSTAKDKDTTTPKSKVDPDTVAKKTTEAIQEQLKNNSFSIPTVNVKNPDPISSKALKSMAETAKYSNTKVQLQADSVDEKGNIAARLYIDPLKAGNVKNNIELGVSLDPEKTKAASDTFQKYFDNEISVVHFDQKGSFGMSIDVAVKVDLSKLNTKTLQFYTYDSVKNTYAPMTVSSYSVDANGYLHFPTGVGNNIVITDKPLNKK